MTQASIEQEIEMEEHEIKEQEQKVAQKANEKIVANPSGISNPRYFENARTPKKAKIAFDLNRMY
ncbi:MAG: hypothetical protein ACTSPS_14835 [Promethearchaeota archaeon]|jgi:hypothetical protein